MAGGLLARSSVSEAGGGDRAEGLLSFGVRGMTCASCARRVEKILSRLSGVRRVSVDLAAGTVGLAYVPGRLDICQLESAVKGLGYQFWGLRCGPWEGSRPADDRPPECCAPSISPGAAGGRAWLWAGPLTSLAVVGFYLGLITLTANWEFAGMQFADYGGWVLALAMGLGIQAALYTRFRTTLRARARRSARGALAAGGGVSGLAMAACCSHYLVAFLPALGLSFLSGLTAFLAEYQELFFLAGLLSNVFGVWLMLRLLARHGMLRPGSRLARLPLGLGSGR